MRIRAHLTYANVMATIAVFCVLAGGGAYAASKIDTPDIANKAVTGKKIDTGAVTTGKLHSRAVTSDKLADGAVQPRNLSESAVLPLAGIVVYNGQIRGSFNSLSSTQPTLTQAQPGVYEHAIPGIDGSNVSSNRLLASVCLVVTGAGEASTRWSGDSGCCRLEPIVRTFDSSGNPANRDFTYLVYLADHGAL
jgi:hypothetical protein